MAGPPRTSPTPAAPAADGAPRAPSRTGLFAALALASIALRPELVGLGPLQADVRDGLDISRAAFGVLSALPLVGMGVFALGAGPLATRLGTRAAVGLALWGIVVGAALRSIAPSYAEVVAATVLLGAGMGLGNALPSLVVKERLADVATRATATYTTGIQVGAAAAAILVVPLAGVAGGWRGSLALLALLPAAAALAWPLLVGHRAAAPRPPRPARRAAAVPAPRPGLPRLRLAATLACMSCTYYGVVAWLSADLVDAGWSDAAAGVALGVLSAVSILSTVVFGLFADRVGSRRGWVAAAMCAMLLGLVGLVAAPALGLVWALALGAGNGAGFGAAMTLPLDLVEDPAMVASLMGPMLFGGYVVSAASPPVLGLLRDVTGGFATGFVLLGALCVAAVVLTRGRSLRHPDVAHAEDGP
jgi:CP family cyanate transporter-like MFS transporter